MFSRSQLNRDFAGVLGINNSVQKTSFVTCQLRCHMKTCFKFYNWRIHSINVVFNSSSICDLERDTSRQNFKHTGQHNKGGVIHIHNHHLVLGGSHQHMKVSDHSFKILWDCVHIETFHYCCEEHPDKITTVSRFIWDDLHCPVLHFQA